jgi:hypothetical protein
MEAACIHLIGYYTVCTSIWADFPTLQRFMIPPSSRLNLKMEAAYKFEMSAALSTSTPNKYPINNY